MRFLTDTQAQIRVVEMLKAIGWDVATVYQHGLAAEPDDARVLAAATQMGRVLITFDYHRGAVGQSVADELRNHGGRVIRVGGGPDQPPERAVGKLLFHHAEWYPWLNVNDGKVVISDKQRPKLIPRSEVVVQIQRIDAEPFAAYLDERAEIRKRPTRTRRRREAPREQASLDLYRGHADAET